jgi:hypothetical protein
MKHTKINETYEKIIYFRMFRDFSYVSYPPFDLAKSLPRLNTCHYPNLFGFAPEAQRILAGGGAQRNHRTARHYCLCAPAGAPDQARWKEDFAVQHAIQHPCRGAI